MLASFMGRFKIFYKHFLFGAFFLLSDDRQIIGKYVKRKKPGAYAHSALI